ncbi:MAG: hypothetical protein JSS60_08300 [Verrucomicrobia bacterium]|nr:hypothetical protein [Verrucomicrobiota bacterium]
MATVSKQPDFSENYDLNALNLQLLINRIEKEKKAGGDQQALLFHLSKALEEVMGEVNSGASKASDKIVSFNFKGMAENEKFSNNSQIPGNASMQQAIGQLMGLLAELEGEIAKWGNEKSQINSQVGTAMLNEMTAQVNEAQSELQKVIDSQSSSDFWSVFTKVAEVVLAVVLSTVAILCGQPELAVIIIAMTVLAVSGLMDKATEGISDLLQKAGMSPEAANLLSAAIIIVATIVITIATCGATASAAADAVTDETVEVAEESTEMTTFSDSSEGSSTSESTSSESAQQSQNVSKWQRLVNAAKWLRENTFGRLPKIVNLGIVAGSMAVGSTNFGQYLAAEVLSKIKDGKEKEALTILIETIVTLLAALAGAGAGATAASTSSLYQLTNISTVLKGLMATEFAVGLAQGGAQIKQGSVQTDLSNETEVLGEIQAFITELQALTNMNNSQMTADTKTLSGQLKAHSEEMATLSADVVKEGQALAQVLQA